MTWTCGVIPNIDVTMLICSSESHNLNHNSKDLNGSVEHHSTNGFTSTENNMLSHMFLCYARASPAVSVT